MIKVIIGKTVIEMTDSQYKDFISSKVDKKILEECREVSKMFKRNEV